MVRVKICGITSVDEACLAAKCGADAIGLLVGQRHTASDFVSTETAREILLSLPPFVTPVLVTHFEDVGEILSIAQKIPCPVLQLHSDLKPSVLKTLREALFPRKILGKVSVQDESALSRACEIEEVVDAIILDSIDLATGRVGGTGHVHDWSLSSKIVSAAKVPVILAGGLKPDNVREALRFVKPWAVDVNSGVEDLQGRKQEERVRRFIESAKKAHES
jgi:phosphoribosylanthranilate isomerase